MSLHFDSIDDLMDDKIGQAVNRTHTTRGIKKRMTLRGVT
jgi:hypothetical protein